MDKKEKVMAVIRALGYKPKIDSDGDVMFCYEMKCIYAVIGDDDEDYLQVVLPQFHEIAEGEDALVLAACNKATRELKMMKVSMDYTCKNVSAACEFYYYDEDSLQTNIAHSLHMLGMVRKAFKKTMMELSE